MNLAFGLNAEVPEGKDVAWGARWIFPDDMLSDRQDFKGMETAEGQKLKSWLNGGAIGKAREKARKWSDPKYLSLRERKDPERKTLYKDGRETVVLYEDETGIIKGNPRGSHGYLYVCAYLKQGG